MRYFLSILCFLLLTISDVFGAAGQIYTNAANSNGKWSDGATWIGGVAPSVDLEAAFITNGIVYYDATNSSFATGGSNITVALNGQLVVTNAYKPSYLLVYSNINGAGNFPVGDIGTPIGFTSSNTPGFVLKAGNSLALTSKTNCWFGDSSHIQLSWVSNILTAGAITINLSNAPVNVGTNSVIWIGEPQATRRNVTNNNYYAISSVSGSVITLQTNLSALAAISNLWPGLALTNTSIVFTVTNAPVQFLDASIVFIYNQGGFGASMAKTNSVTGTRFTSIGAASSVVYSAEGATNLICTNNVFFRASFSTNSGGSGLFRNTISGNVFNNCQTTATGAGNVSNANLIFNNNFENNILYACGACLLSIGIIYNNFVYNCDWGLTAQASGVVVSNNYVYGTLNGALTTPGGNTTGGNTYISNTVINCSGSQSGAFSGGAQWSHNSIIGNTIINCPVYGFTGMSYVGTSGTSGDYFVGNYVSNAVGGYLTLFSGNGSIRPTNNIIASNTFVNCRSDFNGALGTALGYYAYNNTFIGCSNVVSLSADTRWNFYNNTFINCTNSQGFSSGVLWYFYNNTFMNCVGGSSGVNNGGNNWFMSGNTISNCTRFFLSSSSYGVTICNTTNLGNGGVPLTTNCYDAKIFNSPSTNDNKQVSIPFSTIQKDQSYWLSDYGYVTYTNNRYYIYSTSTNNGPIPFSTLFSIRPNTTKTVTLLCTSTNNMVYRASMVTGTGYPYNQQVICSDSSGAVTNATYTLTNTNNFPMLWTLWGDCLSVSNGAVGYVNILVGQDSNTLP